MTITYNHLNLPSKFTFGIASDGNNIEILYDATGQKLRKTVRTLNVVTSTQDYINGVELKNNRLEAIYNEEGRVYNLANAIRAYPYTWQYEYNLKDHLGNTRVAFTDKNRNGMIDNQTEILQENHYYPFGMSFNGAWYSDATAEKYKYLYNGKELNEDFGLNLSDYGARWYDAAAARFWNIDPLADLFSFQSPYAYAANNPVGNIDFMGMGPVGADGLNNEQWMKASNPANHGSEAAWNGTKNTSQQSNKTAVAYGTRTYVNGKLVNDNVEGYNWVENCDCGCPGKPPCDIPTAAIGRSLVWYGLATLPYSYFDGSVRLTNGMYNGSKFSYKYYPSAWTGGSVAKITTYNIPRVGFTLGLLGAAVGTKNDIMGMDIYSKYGSEHPNAVSPNHFSRNLAFTGIGLLGGVYGATGSFLYFTIDNYIGWQNASSQYRNFYLEQKAIGFPISKY